MPKPQLSKEELKGLRELATPSWFNQVEGYFASEVKPKPISESAVKAIDQETSYLKKRYNVTPKLTGSMPQNLNIPGDVDLDFFVRVKSRNKFDSLVKKLNRSKRYEGSKYNKADAGFHVFSRPAAADGDYPVDLAIAYGDPATAYTKVLAEKRLKAIGIPDDLRKDLIEKKNILKHTPFDYVNKTRYRQWKRELDKLLGSDMRLTREKISAVVNLEDDKELSRLNRFLEYKNVVGHRTPHGNEVLKDGKIISSLEAFRRGKLKSFEHKGTVGERAATEAEKPDEQNLTPNVYVTRGGLLDEPSYGDVGVLFRSRKAKTSPFLNLVSHENIIEPFSEKKFRQARIKGDSYIVAKRERVEELNEKYPNYRYVVEEDIPEDTKEKLFYPTHSFREAYRRWLPEALKGTLAIRKYAEVTTDLKPHQKRVIDRLMNQDGLVVAHGLGSGKTLSSIATAEALGLPTAVVVPAALQENYRKEIEKHTDSPIKELNVSSLQKAMRSGFPKADLVVVDEAHRMRDPATKSSRHFKKVKSKKRMLLTASPIYNHPADAAALANLAASTKVLPETRSEFESEYVGAKKVDPGFFARVFKGIEPGERPVLVNTEDLQGKLKKWIDYHENVPNIKDFPTRNEKFIHVPMSEKQQYMYDALMEEVPEWARYKIEKGLPPSKQEKQLINSFLTTPRQLSGSVKPFVHQMTAEEAVPHAAKANNAFNKFKERLNTNKRHKAVVYSNFLEGGLEPYEQLLKNNKIPYGVFSGAVKKKDRDQMVREYNDGKLKALLVSSAGGEGLDLKGTRQIQILDPHWNNEKIEQVIGRGIRYKSHAHLPENERKVDIERYVATIRPGFFQSLLGLKPKEQSTDQYLKMLSEDKDKLNSQLRKLL